MADSAASDPTWPTSEMRGLVDAKDWSDTPLGARETWSPSLRTAVDIVLASGFPMALRWGPDFNLIYNDAYRRIIGRIHPWALGRPARETWPEFWPTIEPLHREILEGKRDALYAEDMSFRVMRPTGKWEDARFTLSYSPTPDPAAPSGIGGVFITAFETTARVRAERQARERQKALRAANAALEAEHGFLKDLFQNAPSFMALLRGPELRFDLANESYLRLVGPRELLGRTMREAVPELAGQGIFERMDRVFASGKPFVGRRVTASLRRRPGGQMERRYYDLVYQPIRDPEGAVSAIFVNGLDVTERVAAEKRLRRMNEILERMVTARTRERDRLWRSSQDLLVAVDAEGIFRAANPAWTTILGWDEEEVVGRSHQFFVHPEDRAASQLAMEKAMRREQPMVETRCLHKDGAWRWIGWVAARDEDLVYASGRHITAQKEAEAELAAAQAALRQSQKMEAIGQLTGGVAHDFNNMLAIVIGGLDLASRRLRRGESGIERYLESAHDSATRAATLTQRLLAFSRQSPLAPTVLVVNSLVASMSELLRGTLGERVVLETVLAGGLWAAHVDPNQLESAIVNLAVNARDAMLYGGKLTIETANTALDDRYAAKEVGVPAGQYVMIAVTDTGLGMTAEVLEKAFDPFFTTKPVGKGTGLGLSMVYGFARQSGGHVRAYSEPGMGTVVKIYLPRHYGSPRDEATVSLPVVTSLAGDRAEVVLVVEDEEGVRQMSVEAVAELGYRVHAAASGEEALTMFDALERVDVLFTDIVMPGMTGRQLADILQRKAPDLKVLYTTGYTRNAIVHNGVLDPDVALLSKPFSVADLALKLREVVER